MKNVLFFVVVVFLFFLAGCSSSRKISSRDLTEKNTDYGKNNFPSRAGDTKMISSNDVVSFAQTLMGVKYKYGAESVDEGFDCSGFVNYVFNHFNISVPRVTTDFTNAGQEIPLKKSKPGDIILFTGSNANKRIVGHVGIITENDEGDVRFIHASTSSGVMISGMNSYFAPRFIKVNRILSGEVQ